MSNQPRSNQPSKPKRPAKGPRPTGAAAGSTSSPVRLQRLLASAGFGSRRQCEELIEAGRVEVDGEVVTRLGTTVDPGTAKVRVDGDLLKQGKLVYFAVNKPIGVVTTHRDPQGRPRVVDLVPPDQRVFPVGRLDRNSEGLILLTNDGELSQKLTHPKFGVRKIYRVTVAGKVDVETLKQMRRGIYLAEGHVRVDGAKLLKLRSRSTELEIVLREGKNREIRRILARLGHKVQQLRRIAVGPLRLGDLPAGAYRALTRQEVEKLWRAADAETSEAGDERQPGAKKRGAKKKKKSASTGWPTASTGRSKTPSGPKAQSARKTSRSTETISPSEISSNTTIGAVIGGDAEERSSTRPAKRKSTKPRRGRSQPSGRAASTQRGSSRKSMQAKKTRGKGPRPGKQSRRKRS
jgi:23S rRNA pseudouridine2605 synthase